MLASRFGTKAVGLHVLAAMLGIAAIIALAARSPDALEQWQAVFFLPLLLLSFALIRRPELRLPVPVIGAAAALWGFSQLNMRGLLPATLSRSPVYLARLANDPSHAAAQSFFRGFNEIGRAYATPGMRKLHRAFAAGEARVWLDDQPGSVFMLAGDRDRLNVVFSPAVSRRLAVSARAPAAEAGKREIVEREATKHGLRVDADIVLVSIPALGEPFAAVLGIESFSLPAEPAELAQNLLAWLARGLSPLEVPPAAEAAFRRDALTLAAATTGKWRSATPQAVAYFYLGLVDILEMARAEFPEPAVLRTAFADLASAAKRVRARYDPEILAAVLTNTGILCLLEPPSPRSWEQARALFSSAARLRDSDGTPVRAARAAQLNLVLLDRMESGT